RWGFNTTSLAHSMPQGAVHPSFQGEAAAKRRREDLGIHAVAVIVDRCLTEFRTVAKRRWNGMATVFMRRPFCLE
ncbi:hypothetical protein, partial [Mesorhizobium sp.]|uniref:hypothetical protein n=1 Tax=Mesorhizobium sp. TaxID=1871066 RepID=UPI0025E8C715